MKYLFLSVGFTFLVFCTVSCGAIGLGSSSTVTANDSKPSGTTVSQGVFTSLNGKTVTGTASIILDATSTSVIVRLEGLVAPSETGLIVVLDTANETLYSSNLRSVSGSQNYYTGLMQGSSTYSAVRIVQSRTMMDYGKANLESL